MGVLTVRDSQSISWDSYTVLPLEREGDHRAARRDLDILDVMNNPSANGLCHVLRVYLPEEGPYSEWLSLARCSTMELIRAGRLAGYL